MSHTHAFCQTACLTNTVTNPVTQANHFSARCIEAANKPTSWAVRQIETAANFCVGSWFWSLSTLYLFYSFVYLKFVLRAYTTPNPTINA